MGGDNKLFSPDDHAMLMLLVHRVLPQFNTSRDVKWIRNIITSYHDWYQFFVNEKTRPCNLYKHHNYLSKVIQKKKQLADVIETRDEEYLANRERISQDLRMVLIEFGKIQSQFSYDQVSEINALVSQNAVMLNKLYTSNDEKPRIHFYFVIGYFYRRLINKWCITKITSTLFYEFCNIVENLLQTLN